MKISQAHNQFSQRLVSRRFQCWLTTIIALMMVFAAAPIKASSMRALYDIDGNGQHDALTDGLLTLRYLLGLSNGALLEDALASDATRTDSVSVRSHLDTWKNKLDIDGNGTADALTDGLLLFRYLVGIRGPTLVVDALAADATRHQADRIEAYIAPRDFGLPGPHLLATPKVSDDGKAVLYYPQDASADNKTPVVFLAPGWASVNAADYESLLRFIVSHGYSVMFLKDDTGAYGAAHLLAHATAMAGQADVAPMLDTSRIGVVGHSSGGGHAFSLLRDLSTQQNWGSNGRFIFAMEPWFAFDMTTAQMQDLPSNTRVVIIQFGVGGNNAANNTDPRIPLSLYYLLTSIAPEHKDYQIHADADHNYPMGNRPYSQMQGILRPLGALLNYSFANPPDYSAHEFALQAGSDDPYRQGHGIQQVKLIPDYQYRCHGNDSSGASATLSQSDIDYCAIHAAALPPESGFTPIATDASQIQPEPGAGVVGQVFGQQIQRMTRRIDQSDTPLTDGAGERISRANAHPYPKTQAWNSDMTMIRLRYRLYDADTLEELPVTRSLTSLADLYNRNGGLSEMKWSSTRPNLFYGVWGSEFHRGVIDRQNHSISTSLVHDFSPMTTSYDRFTIGKYEGNIDFNDRYVAFAARTAGTTHLTVIVYDIQQDQVLVTKDFPAVQWPDEGQVFDWLSISPLGDYLLMSTDGRVDQYDRNLNFIRQLAGSAGHGDLGIDQNGEQVYVQFEYGADRGIWIYRLRDGQRMRLLPDKYNGGHISCRNHQRPGWCYIGTNAEGHREAFALRLDYSGPDDHRVQRFAQTHTSGHNPQVNVSPDGKRLLFYSDWGDANLSWADRDTYHVR